MTTFLDDQQAPGATVISAEPGESYRPNDAARYEHTHSNTVRENRQEVATVSAILAVAAGLRLWNLGRIGFRGDESVYAGQAAILSGHGGFSRHFILASRGNSNFLIFQGMLSFVYRLFGVSDVTARGLSAVLSILTVLVIYFIGRILYGRRAAAFAAALVAISAYSVALGRLALLDAAVTFFISAAVLFLILWLRRESVGWLAMFTLTTSIATQTKVTSVLLVVIFAAVLLIDGAWRRLRVRTLAIAGLAGLVALTPTVIEVASNAGNLSSFLGSSVLRNSPVPWTYYFTTLLSYSGAPFLVLVGIGLVAAIVRPRRDDLLPWLWLGVFALFLFAYPLKAFNYLLPLIPALALLAGRGLGSIRVPRVRLWVVSLALVLVAVVGSAPFLAPSRQDDASVGMREAAYWLRDNVPNDAGVMTMSHGSAQSVLSFYANIDGYPFGRFRLATVLPGGHVVTPAPTATGKLPLDWISKWPPRLLRNRTVSYFVYATTTLDDTIEGNGASKSLTQRQFRTFIESYGGVLVHTVYRGNRPRAFIYRATKTESRPEIRYSLANKKVNISGGGFAPNSAVALRYHGEVVKTGRTDRKGAVTLTPFPMPLRPQSRYYFVIADAEGNTASANGLPSPSMSYLEANGKLYLYGQHYAPNDRVSIAYHQQPIAEATTGADGSFRAQIAYPAKARPRYQLRATDSKGGSAWAASVPSPSIRVSVRRGVVKAVGEGFTGGSAVAISYNGRVVARPKAIANGSFSVTFALPSVLRPSDALVATDRVGRKVQLTGLGPNGIAAQPTKTGR